SARLAWGLVAAGALSVLLAAVLVFFGAIEIAPALVPVAARPTLARALSDGRATITRAAVEMVRLSPVLGTGLGTYGSLQPILQPRETPNAFAHDDWAQWLGETGALGALVLAGGLALLARALCRAWGAPDDRRFAVAGAWSSLAALAVHSFFDWNLHVPANALLACFVAGLALSAGGSRDSRSSGPESGASGVPIAAWLLAAAAVLAASLSVGDAVAESSSRRLREALELARHADGDARRARAAVELRRAVTAGEALDRWMRSDAERVVLLGQAYLHLAEAGVAGSRERADAWFAHAAARSPVAFGRPAPPGTDGGR
ncbi:MAG: O-antigen ligase family protein, partial [Alphaproteobacteria bacterium]